MANNYPAKNGGDFSVCWHDGNGVANKQSIIWREKVWGKLPLAKQVAGKNLNTELKESMISILFSYACLEAYINMVGKDKLGSGWSKFGVRCITLESKWRGISKKLVTVKLGKQHSVFKRDEEPFKSFLAG